MIKYTLQCESTGGQFEGWFSNSGDFDAQKKKGLLACPCCGGKDVAKAIMAPAVVTASPGTGERDAADEVARLRAHIKERYADVGDSFADEALALHEGKKPAIKRYADKEGIVGVTSPEKARELHEKGVPVMPLPFPKYDA